MTAFPRLMGAATLAYSVAVVARPKVLAGPCALVDEHGDVPRHVATAVRAVSTRDAIISALMVVAPAGPALRAVTTVRGLCDLSDTAVFGLPVRDPAVRRKILAVGGLWGGTVLLSRRWA
ncbi:MAG: hypothetical protein ACXVFU_18105 [Nocardioidaceae bacterium]